MQRGERLAARRGLLTAMAGRPAAAARRGREEEGFTLVELLVGTLIALVIVGGGVMVFTTGIRSQPRIDSQAQAIQQARFSMERLIREVRQGASVPAATGSSLAIVTYVKDVACGTTTPQCRVTYTCTAGTCTRTVSRPDGSQPSAPVTAVTGIDNSSSVFAYTAPTDTTPASVGVTLVFPGERDDDASTLTDAAALRNPSA